MSVVAAFALMTQRVTDGESNYHTYLASVARAVKLTAWRSACGCPIGPGAWLLSTVGGMPVTMRSLLVIVSPDGVRLGPIG